MGKSGTIAMAAMLTRSLRRIEALCRARGGRLTRQRRAVLIELLSANRPLSAYEIVDRLRSADGTSTPASVYRTLAFLMAAGIVHRLETTRSFVPCEHPDAPHRVQFVICRACGRVVEAEDERIAAAADRLGRRLGFALEQRTVELTGVCEGCRDRATRH